MPDLDEINLKKKKTNVIETGSPSRGDWTNMQQSPLQNDSGLKRSTLEQSQFSNVHKSPSQMS